MLKKEVCIKCERETRKAVGRQLFELRRHRKKTIKQVCSVCSVSENLVERWEIGKGYLDFHYLSVLAGFFDKKIVISFENVKEEK